jgi:RIO-like serine/threonine protein kinase
MGRDEPPEQVEIDGTTWRRTEIVKHDFFAATAFYRDQAGNKSVLKISRCTPYFGLPVRWLGYRLCRREVRIYNRLQTIPNIPRMLGRYGRYGFLHSYVEGRPLARHKPVPDGFFSELYKVLKAVHYQKVAYIDTNKPQNILIGDDGKPYLIDFQISWDHGPAWLLRRLQRGDLYHLLKHRRRMRPDEMTPEELKLAAAAERVGFWVKVHRFIFRPYFLIRRKLFRKLEKDGRLLPSGSD